MYQTNALKACHMSHLPTSVGNLMTRLELISQISYLI